MCLGVRDERVRLAAGFRAVVIGGAALIPAERSCFGNKGAAHGIAMERAAHGCVIFWLETARRSILRSAGESCWVGERANDGGNDSSSY